MFFLFVINFSLLILLKLLFFTDPIRRNESKFIEIAELSDFKRCHIVGDRMDGTSVTKTAELFSIAKSTVSKVMTAFEKKKEKPPHRSKTQKESESCLIGTVGLLHGLLKRITRIRLRKLQLSLMTISRTQFPQKL